MRDIEMNEDRIISDYEVEVQRQRDLWVASVPTIPEIGAAQAPTREEAEQEIARIASAYIQPLPQLHESE